MSLDSVYILLISIVIAFGIYKAMMYIDYHGWEEVKRQLTVLFLICLLAGFIYLVIYFFIWLFR